MCVHTATQAENHTKASISNVYPAPTTCKAKSWMGVGRQGSKVRQGAYTLVVTR